MTAPRTLDFFQFLKERHTIYVRRKEGRPYPWTDDPVLRHGRFCNVFRELDRVTIWVRKNIREPFADHPNLWIMLAIARYINWPPTLLELIQTKQWPSNPDFQPEMLTVGLEHRAARGEKVYTGAYMIRAESDPKAEWYSWSKHRYIAEMVIGRLWQHRDRWVSLLEGQNAPGDHVRLEEVWRYFQSKFYVGWGPFMAYEVVTDMRHTRYLREAPDIYTWANAGPGAIRGLNRLHGRPLKTQPKPEVTNAEMRELMEELNAVPDQWCPGCNPDNCPGCGTGNGCWSDVFGPLSGPPRFEMRDIEHSLCEFDKYERVRLGEGQMRSHYDPRRSYPLD